jgi:hypothetical protein
MVERRLGLAMFMSLMCLTFRWNVVCRPSRSASRVPEEIAAMRRLSAARGRRVCLRYTATV